MSPSEVQEAVVTTYCRDVQGHNDGLSANWDFSGDPCPIEKFEWAIHKFDGTVVLNMTELPPGRTGDRSQCFTYSPILDGSYFSLVYVLHS